MPSFRPFLTVVKSNSAVASPSITHANASRLIHTLEAMLAKAHAGEMTGLMYAVRMNGVDHGLCVTGAYEGIPLECLASLDTFTTLLSRNSGLL